MIRNLGLVGTLSLIGLLAGCSGDVRIENPRQAAAVSPKPETPSPQEYEVNQTELNEQSPVIGRIGDVLSGLRTKITLNSVEIAPSERFIEPTFDYFIVLNFTIENTSGESVSISSLGSFELQGSDLYIYGPALGVQTRGSLDSTLQPGNSLRGEIAFDVPRVENFELRFREEMFSEAGAIFRFALSEISE